MNESSLTVGEASRDDFERVLAGDEWYSSLLEWHRFLHNGGTSPQLNVLVDVLIDQWDSIEKREYSGFSSGIEIVMKILVIAGRIEEVKERLINLVKNPELVTTPSERLVAFEALALSEESDWFIDCLREETSALVKGALIGILADKGASQAFRAVRAIRAANKLQGSDQEDEYLDGMCDDFLERFGGASSNAH